MRRLSFLIFVCCACADDPLEPITGDSGVEVAMDAAPPPFERCANGKWTADGTISGAPLEVMLNRGSTAGFNSGLRRSIAMSAGEGALSVGLIEVAFDIPVTGSGRALISSPSIAGGAWLCGAATFSVFGDPDTIELAEVASLGSCASHPSVDGAIEACISSNRGCNGRNLEVSSSVDGVVLDSSAGYGSTSGGAGAHAFYFRNDIIVGSKDGIGLYFSAAGSFDNALCAERTTVTQDQGFETKRVRLEGLHRLGACSAQPTIGSLFICTG